MKQDRGNVCPNLQMLFGDLVLLRVNNQTNHFENAWLYGIIILGE